MNVSSPAMIVLDPFWLGEAANFVGGVMHIQTNGDVIGGMPYIVGKKQELFLPPEPAHVYPSTGAIGWRRIDVRVSAPMSLTTMDASRFLKRNSAVAAKYVGERLREFSRVRGDWK